ncbi:MAG: YdcF family protein [Hyphomicrobium sp.]|jgi:uncharacterized SAM-binding protein YcdF (DUF218 family)
MRTRRILIGTVGAMLWLLAFGFLLFAASVMRDPERQNAKADGIVVLTGGQTRIAEAARLLDEHRGERLLISGVNQKTGRPSLLKLSGLEEKKFDCCVDLGYAALDTVGNAAEARRWAEALRYKKLIVVTASYHMPRSIAELARVMPGVELIPHPVLPEGLRRTAWWLDPVAMRVLVAEYLKFLPAAARLVVARGVSPWHGTLTASTVAPPHKS